MKYPGDRYKKGKAKFFDRKTCTPPTSGKSRAFPLEYSEGIYKKWKSDSFSSDIQEPVTKKEKLSLFSGYSEGIYKKRKSVCFSSGYPEASYKKGKAFAFPLLITFIGRRCDVISILGRPTTCICSLGLPRLRPLPCKSKIVIIIVIYIAFSVPGNNSVINQHVM